MSVDIVIRAINEASGEITKVNASLEGTEKAAKGADTETKKVGLSMTDVNSAMQIGKQVIDAVGQAYGATIAKSQSYAAQVRDLKAITGESAEATSRLIQFTDDFGVSSDDLSASMRVLTKNGLVPNKDTIIALAKEYQSIQDPLQRNEFLIQNLGRASTGYTNLLSQNTDELQRNFDAVSSNLILTEKQLAQAEQLRLSQDQLNDTWEGLSITVGSVLTPAFAAWVDLINRALSQPDTLRIGWEGLIPIFGPLITTMQNLGDSQNRLAAEAQNVVNAQDAQKTSTGELAVTQEEAAAASQKLLDMNKQLVSTTQAMQNAENSYNQKFKSLTDERISLEEKIKEAKTQGSKTTVAELNGYMEKLVEVKSREFELGKEREKQTKQFISDMLLQELAVGGLTEVELEEFGKQQVAWGLWSKDIQEKARAAQAEAQKVIEKIRAVEGKSVEIKVNTTYTSTGTSGTIPGRAAGGPVAAGNLYQVGEKGPEMFVPWTNGTIIPNGAGSNVSGGNPVTSSVGGGTSVVIHLNLTYAPGISMQGSEEIKQFVLDGIRKAQADGLIPVGR